MKKKIKKTKSIKLNYIYNVSYQILTLITPLITAPYLSRVLKVEGIGIYSYTASIVTYFVMFAALGTINYGNREISYLQNDRQNRSIVFWEIDFLSIGSVLCCLAAYSFFMALLTARKGLDPRQGYVAADNVYSPIRTISGGISLNF